MAVYAAVRELGSLLKHECLWMPVAVLRASIIKTIRGKWSHCLKVLLRNMLLDEGNVRDGLLVPDIGVVFMKLANILGDADALRQCWSAKGAAGIFPTIETLNVCNVGPKSLVPHDTTGTFVTIAEVDIARFQFCSNDDIWYKSDVLEGMATSAHFTKAAVEEKATSVGLNVNPHGLLQDRELRPLVRPMDCNTHDSTHIFFSDGLCNTEVDLLLPKLAAHGITFAVLRAYVSADFRRPRMYTQNGVNLAKVFSESRHANWKSSGGLSTFASEMVGLIMPLCHLLELECAIALPLEVDSFKKLTAVVRIIGRAKLGHDVADDLQVAFRAHGEAHILAYDEDAVKPKFHFARLLSRQLRRDGVHLDTFTPERKHAHSKYAAEPIDNTRRTPLDNNWCRQGHRDGSVSGRPQRVFFKYSKNTPQT